MAISLNSLVGFNSTCVYRSSIGASPPQVPQFTSFVGMFGPKIHLTERRRGPCFSGSESEGLVTNTTDMSVSSDQLSSPDPLLVDATGRSNQQSQTSVSSESRTQDSGLSNGSMVPADMKPEGRPNLDSTPRRSRLTARERLKAARVLSRYSESKASKSDMGSKVLDALKESDRGRGKKRSGLPEAPTNLFDDSKRGLPKPGWTFQFPGGNDLFVIVVSFVTISTVMFATTYIVWKAGAIHFNEY